MFDLFVIPGHDRRLIPEGRLSGPMPWVIAIMIFLTVLAAAAGLAFAQAASDVNDELSSRATVQIIEANADSKKAQTDDVAARLRGLQLVSEVRVLPQEEVEQLIEPWLGVQDLAEGYSTTRSYRSEVGPSGCGRRTRSVEEGHWTAKQQCSR